MNNMLAHVKQDENGKWREHLLEEHLLAVGELAALYAKDFGSSDWAELAGIWHDLGKYRPSFQKYIKKASGYDPEAHIEQNTNKIHSMTGAVHAIEKLKAHGQIIAYLIAGHHTGLPDWNTAEAGSAALSKRLDDAKKEKHLEESLSNNPPKEILDGNMPSTKPPGGSHGLHLWMRMLFSSLVDADFIDTEQFMLDDQKNGRGDWPTISTLKCKFDAFMQEKTIGADNTLVNRIRAGILEDCRHAARNPKGIFTLTVPTGGGKTLSGLAFGLDHAAIHGMKRIIIAIPYTSIIEQTAQQYKDIFGGAIIEHHSNLDSGKENAKSRLASENWDAPVIVTTNVQLLESLFSARTSQCRKLHNIANSVIILDEAQLLPPDFLQPVLDVLKLLVKHYGVTLVLSTATQPALTSRKDNHGRTKLRGIDNAEEIIGNVSALYGALDRVNVELPDDMTQRATWESIAEELKSYESVLAIVNTRKDCRALFDLMPKGTIHLSALMCGEHRSRVIAKIKQKLKNGESVRVISTQLVEAGVDLDFPVVYRALAGLDSIAQAAGRCNREGKLQKGKVVVFVPPKSPPKGMLLFGEQATRSVLSGHAGNPLSHDLYTNYFEQYYQYVEPDKFGIHDLLTKDAQSGIVQFRSAADKFKLIDDKGVRQILVPYDPDYDGKVDGLIGLLKSGSIDKWILRKLQRYSVSIYEHEFIKLQAIGAIEQVHPDLWAVSVTTAYDPVMGLLVADDLYTTDPSNSVM